MIPANKAAETDLAEFVKLCGSKRSAAKAIGVPRKTLCRWLLDIERTGKINARQSRVRAAMERINAVCAKMRQDGPCFDVADAFMSVFGLQRAGRGDDMTCASFPGDYSGLNNCGAPLPDDFSIRNEFATSAFATTQGTNTEIVQRLMRKSVHKSRIGDGKERKRKTVLFLYDIHLPNHSEENIALALDYAQSRHDIDTVVLGGDFLDCAGISRFNNDPNECIPLAEEIARGVEFLAMLRNRFPAASIKLVKGNHEQRLQRFLWEKAVELNGLKGLTIQEQLELERFNVEWVDNLQRIRDGRGAYKIGKLFVLHGHELGVCPSVDCARKYFFKALENIIVGHVHRDDKHTEPTLDGTKGAWVVGHLQDERPQYRPFNKWVAGFAIASFDNDGLFSVKNKTIIEGRVL